MSEQLMQAIMNRDSQSLSRLANKYQPAQERPATGVVNTEAERLVDALFRQLKQVFPASAATNLRTEADEAAAKQQWILAFAENGIVRREQLAAGMKRARASLSPFWPSPGQFIAWCREGEFEQAGLPAVAELLAMVRTYCAQRGLYASPMDYPWQNPAHYWLVTGLYSGMRLNDWTEQELAEQAKAELVKMAKRIASGETIPEPVPIIERSKPQPVSSKRGLEIIARLRHDLLRKPSKKFGGNRILNKS
ncbi:replication protein P [Cronobacter sakazakii]|uniref:replication protein P n=3 Tax=Cronobacter sakazakii TaxID=28141 RepID=UPI000948CB55|nr:replication protein P [Cronobacter sakazakii]EKA1095123.1 DNA replication protein [Cronobacter sakazakii]EKK4066479.1 DNA replication protein [Cronobacter sakazakii]EKK7697093.1 DNA replication protein [Cronobacter sakazakii]ELY2522143.1 DNA replication protein [Cronobacter sakazakii]ELY3816469.1 DNA replication protein [Cronobacter sakazakii]